MATETMSRILREAREAAYGGRNGTVHRSPNQPAYKMPKLEADWPFPITHLENGWGVSVATITPALAEELLKANHPNNRKLKEPAIARYMRDMGQKSWAKTHQGIAFDTKGRLFDGQNRLQACVRSGHAFETIVFFGCGGKDSMLSADIGERRTGTDGAWAAGYKITAGQIATLSNFILGMSGKISKRSNAEVVDLYVKYREVIDWAGTLPKSSMLKIPLRGALCRAYYHVEKEKLERFVGVYLLEIPATEPGDRTAIVLRKSLDIQSTFAGGVARKTTYCKSQGAIRGFLNGEDLKIMKETETVDLFPLPTDKQLANRKKSGEAA